MSKPYLSIVITGRNDNYGGDFSARLQRSVNYNFRQLSLHNIKSELIFVNYNPLPAQPIEHFINWPKSNGIVSIKIIEVNNERHQYIVKNYAVKDIPVLEFVAKNIGIRRAQGEFILSTNADILFHKQVFQQLSKLKPEKFYRANRFDFSSERNIEDSDEIQNITTIWLKAYYKNFNSKFPDAYKELLAKTGRVGYYVSYELKKMFNPLIRFIWGTEYHPKAEMKYHCHCSGDFMLMHSDKWNEMRGFWEKSYVTLHVDSLLVIQAAANGLKEEVLSFPVFHQNHNRRYDHSSENTDYREHYLFFQSEAQKMLKNKKHETYNSVDWGLFTFNLPYKEY